MNWHTIVRRNFDQLLFFQPMTSHSTWLMSFDWLTVWVDMQSFILLSYARMLVLRKEVKWPRLKFCTLEKHYVKSTVKANYFLLKWSLPISEFCRFGSFIIYISVEKIFEILYQVQQSKSLELFMNISIDFWLYLFNFKFC